MNYKHLQYFHAVAVGGSIARAAQQLHVTAQAISTQLGLLEEQFRAPLFRKKGRGLELTDAGKVALQYSERIFDLGNELEQTMRRGGAPVPETLRVGICDIVPKTIAFRLLQPAREAGMAMRLICREGHFDALMGELAAHRLDLVLADRGLAPGGAIRGYTHLLGTSSLTVLGHPRLCRAWSGAFPGCLREAPFLLPGPDAAVRTQLQGWFEEHALRPIVVGEFDDGALLKAFARAGAGFMVAPSAVAAAVQEEYGLEAAGSIASIAEQFYALTVERQLDHPAVRRILENAATVFTPVTAA
ncbi:LysR family transcriptional regulator [Massilia niabensis]|uniref:LysR family transcriptional regulator n=1 Tax=Massilia niabensis TaxID=544910 RepID=A0ABW0LBM1_9BURK